MLNALRVNTSCGEKVFYLFKIKSMEACERIDLVKADFTARMEYIAEGDTNTPEIPKALQGVTQVEGNLLDVYVLEKVEAMIKQAFCDKKPILAWVAKDQATNKRTIEAAMLLPEPTEAEHVNYYQKALGIDKKYKDM